MMNETPEFSSFSGIDPSRMSEDDFVTAIIDHLRLKLQNGMLSPSEGVQLTKLKAMQKKCSWLECEKAEIEAAQEAGFRLLSRSSQAH